LENYLDELQTKNIKTTKTRKHVKRKK